MALRQDYREQLIRAHQELGFQMVRFHGLFDDDMSAFAIRDDGTVYYSWYNADSIFDFLLSIGMRPLVELSFMPTQMASGTATIFHYRGNITPPRNWTLWYDMIRNFILHLVSRYGLDEIRQWYFEVWNEPNCGFWTGTQWEYFHLLQVTSAAIKSVDAQIRVGGPATCQSQWIVETLNFVKQNNVSLDFVSTHLYPTDFTPARDLMKKVISSVRRQVGSLPLIYTEWNDGLYSNPAYHDVPYAAAAAVKYIIDVMPYVDVFSWWTFTDIFEEGGFVSTPFQGGFGLQTIHGIPKPSWRAFELLHRTGDKYVDVQPAEGYDTVGIWITLNRTHAVILIYNFNVVGAPIRRENVCLVLSGVRLPFAHNATLQQINEHSANPIMTWIAMGRPEYPTQTQLQKIYDASVMKTMPFPPTVLDTQSVMFTLEVPPQSVAAVTLPL
jgi:xylan 1,4-beta-xylosidase